MKRFAITLLAVAFISSTSLAAFAIGPPVIKIPAPMMGTVTFPHAMHQKIVHNFKTCHHMGVAAGKCTKCHGVLKNAPSAKDAFHTRCKGCHAKMHGPTNCKACHHRD